MKKILEVKNEEHLRETIELCMQRWVSNLVKSKDMTNDMLKSLLLHYELKDVVEFEAMVINRPSMVHPTMPDKAIIIPPNLKFGDKLRVFAVKQKGKKP